MTITCLFKSKLDCKTIFGKPAYNYQMNDYEKRTKMFRPQKRMKLKYTCYVIRALPLKSSRVREKIAGNQRFHRRSH